MMTSGQKEQRPVSVARHDPIGLLIKRAREQCGMSQYTLAELVVAVSGNDGLSRTEVARWERGRRIPGPYWRRWLSIALDLPSDQLGAAARSARRRRRAASSQAPLTRSRP